MNSDVFSVIVSVTEKRNRGLFEDASDKNSVAFSRQQVDPESSNRNSRFSKYMTLTKRKINLF